MPEVLEAPEVQTPPTEAAPSLGDAFAARTTVEEAPLPAEETAPAPTPAAVTTPPVEAAPPAEKKAVDYGDFVKELGYETPEALKERLAATKDFDPKTVEALKANQRDAHDEAVRAMLADPVKARTYFELQSTDFAEQAKSDPEGVLFAEYRHKNPSLSADLARIKFDRLQAAEYPHLAEAEEGDPLYEQDKQLQAHAAAEAAKTMEGAKEAAKVALLPKSAEAEGPTQAQRDAAVAEWLKNVDATLAAPIEQTVQVDGKPVKVVYDSKDAGLKAALDNPEDFFLALIYPNGLDKPADFAGIAKAYASIKQPDAIALAAAEAAKAGIGAHKTLTDLTNPAPDAPQPVVAGAAGGYKSAFANAKSAE